MARVQSEDQTAIMQRALELGWPVRQHAGQLSFLLPYDLSLGEIVAALEGTKVSAVSVQPVRLDDVYLDLIGDSPFTVYIRSEK